MEEYKLLWKSDSVAPYQETTEARHDEFVWASGNLPPLMQTLTTPSDLQLNQLPFNFIINCKNIRVSKYQMAYQGNSAGQIQRILDFISNPYYYTQPRRHFGESYFLSGAITIQSGNKLESSFSIMSHLSPCRPCQLEKLSLCQRCCCLEQLLGRRNRFCHRLDYTYPGLGRFQ